jgi:hypothetical protein
MRRVSVGRFTLGLVLAILGVALLLDLNYGWNSLDTVIHYWPAVLILLGLEYVLAARDPEQSARVSIGSVVVIAVLLCLAWVYSISGFVGNWSWIGISYPGQEVYTIELPVNAPFSGSTRLDVKALRDVVITGTESGAVNGTAAVEVRARTKNEARQVAEKLSVTARPSGQTVYLEIETPENLSKFVAIHPSFSLLVPASASISSHTVSGDTEIANVRGDVVAGSISGEVRVDAAPASVAIDTISGDVSATLDKDTRNLSIKTISGNAVLNAPTGTGGDLSFSAVSGDVSSSLPGIENSRSPGRHTASGRFGTGATSVHMSTVSGNLTIR